MKNKKNGFEPFLIDVLETTLIKKGVISDRGPRTWQVLAKIIDACVWRYGGQEDIRVPDAEAIIEKKYPDIYVDYVKYKMAMPSEGERNAGSRY